MNTEKVMVKELTDLVETIVDNSCATTVLTRSAVDLLVRANAAIDEWETEDEETDSWFAKFSLDNVHEMT
jgi:hypothetical protein